MEVGLLGQFKRRICIPHVRVAQRAHQTRCACRNSRPARTSTSCYSSSGGSSICWVPNTGTDGPLAVRAGTGGQLAPMTGTRGLDMGGRLLCSTGVACSLVASVGAGVGCSADGVVGGKGACCCLPDARAVPHGNVRAAPHVRDVRGVRYVLLAPRLPLACWGWDLLRKHGFWPPHAARRCFLWVWGMNCGIGGKC